MSTPIEKLPCDPDIRDYPHDIAATLNQVIDKLDYIERMIEELPDFPRIQSIATTQDPK